MIHIFIYPDNLKAKPTLWLWTLQDVVVIGVGLVLSVLVLVEWGFLPPLVGVALFAFLAIRVEDTCILDFLRWSIGFLCLKQQYYEWRQLKFE